MRSSRFLLAFILLFSVLFSKEQINIKFMFSSGALRQYWYETIIDQFEEKYPQYEINSSEYIQEIYKESMNEWLTSSKEETDILFWFGGEKLFNLVRKNQIEPLTDLWIKNDWEKKFHESAISAIRYKTQKWAVPISYYQWGFYYNKEIFAANNLSEPQTWEEFLAICKVLKDDNIFPITMGIKNQWPTAGWFDYLNLRINGLSFHKKLMQGKIDYTDSRVKIVFEKWKDLIDNGYFEKDLENFDWRGVLGGLYRGRSAMYLMGNFIVPQIPDDVRKRIGYFRFPQINEKIDFYEEAPTDILFIPQNAINKEAAKVFLTFIAQKKNLGKMNKEMKLISPLKGSQKVDDYFLKKGSQVLKEAKGVSQFFDRDTHPEIYQLGMKLFVQFIKQEISVEEITKQLEEKRKEVFGKK